MYSLISVNALSEDDMCAMLQPVGQAWRSNEVMTIGMTRCYTVNGELGKVDTIDCAWGGFAAAVERIEDVFDIYIKQVGSRCSPFASSPMAAFACHLPSVQCPLCISCAEHCDCGQPVLIGLTVMRRTLMI